MEKKYIDGLYCKAPHEKAPDFVKADIGVNVENFIKWLEANKNAKGYVNLQILEAKNGNCYIKHNDFKKETLKETPKEDEEIEIENLNW